MKEYRHNKTQYFAKYDNNRHMYRLFVNGIIYLPIEMIEGTTDWVEVIPEILCPSCKQSMEIDDLYTVDKTSCRGKCLTESCWVTRTNWYPTYDQLIESLYPPISENTLKQIDSSMDNLEEGKVSKPLDIDHMNDVADNMKEDEEEEGDIYISNRIQSWRHRYYDPHIRQGLYGAESLIIDLTELSEFIKHIKEV